jgi:drug/metabolite transporter (DMT)-like permease
MVTGILGYIVVALAVRQLKPDLSLTQILAIRSIGGLIIAGGLAAVNPKVIADLRTIRIRDHGLRSLLHAVGSIAIVWSLAHLPLALVASIDFTGPLFAAAIGILALRTWPRNGTWAGLGLIFIGAATLIALHAGHIGPAIVVPFIGVVVLTTTNMMLGSLSSKHRTVTILLVMNAIQLPIYLALATIPDLLAMIPTPAQLPSTLLPINRTTFTIAVIATAVSGYMTQMSLSHATRHGTPVQVSAMDTLRIPALAITGALLFSESISQSLAAPGLVIMAGAVITAIYGKSR